MKTVGVLGGGQLGMLLSQSIMKLGGNVIIYDPDPQAPACRCVNKVINASWSDEGALTSLFEQCDIVTYEFENVESAPLVPFIDKKPILPSVAVLQTTQSRAMEKTFLKKHKLPHVNFAIANDVNILSALANDLSFPIIIKSDKGGYDGHLQKRIQSRDSLKQSLPDLASQRGLFPAVIEEVIPLHCELSLITARSRSGNEIAFPISENEHVDHILSTSLMPARVSNELKSCMKEIALSATRILDVVGLLCTEFFVSKTRSTSGLSVGEFTLFVNEFAPRPHNSGHVTTAACSLSQFDALARILLDLPLSTPQMLALGYFCMGNLLGNTWLAQDPMGESDLDLSCLKNHPSVIDIVLYGKRQARPQRKMGHFITYAPEAQEALCAVDGFRKGLIISAPEPRSARSSAL